ncbi:unnamed protein product [Tilletia controversa]|nr:unnamed protein product [Tilletia controversa]CAD6957889.1 unnamed protein product [Tilletia controversa]CAD6976528.1 unnamed protein product [Tilletia controversa]
MRRNSMRTHRLRVCDPNFAKGVLPVASCYRALPAPPTLSATGPVAPALRRTTVALVYKPMVPYSAANGVGATTTAETHVSGRPVRTTVISAAPTGASLAVRTPISASWHLSKNQCISRSDCRSNVCGQSPYPQLGSGSQTVCIALPAGSPCTKGDQCGSGVCDSASSKCAVVGGGIEVLLESRLQYQRMPDEQLQHVDFDHNGFKHFDFHFDHYVKACDHSMATSSTTTSTSTPTAASTTTASSTSSKPSSTSASSSSSTSSKSSTTTASSSATLNVFVHVFVRIFVQLDGEK